MIARGRAARRPKAGEAAERAGTKWLALRLPSSEFGPQ
jgi:hypothetical protein